VIDLLQTYGTWILFGLVLFVLSRSGGQAPKAESKPPEPAAATTERAPPAGTTEPAPSGGMRFGRSSMRWLFVLVSLVFWFTLLTSMNQSQTALNPEVPLSQVAAEARAGQIRKISVQGDALAIERVDGARQHSRKEPLVPVAASLAQLGVEPAALAAITFEVRGPPAWGGALNVLLAVFPIVLLVGWFVLMNRGGQQGMGRLFSFGQSRAKVVTVRPPVTFADVAGADEAKQELQEVVEFLRDPGRFQALGARIPKGVLLIGPPGTGKTLLARAVAGEAQAAFFHLSGSEFVEMFVGVGASRVRDLFAQARKAAPCILFIDELDAVGRHRGAGLGGGNDEREQTLNQILVEMDGFEPTVEVIVLAATNRPDVLDPALLRPGRFDRRVMVDLPDLVGRGAILAVHARGKPLAPDVELAAVAGQTPGFSGADLANLLNEGALLAARGGATQIVAADLEAAAERVTLGPERRSRVLNVHERAVMAFHEAGHALVARLVPNADPVHKITIVGHGWAGGFTRLLPREEHRLWSKSRFLDALAWTLGGQAAEELVFGEATSGASNDLEKATAMARDMVTRYGMSRTLGPIAVGRHETMVFLGRDIGERQQHSEETARLVDREVRQLAEGAKTRATQLLTEHRAVLDRVAEALIQRETLDGPAFEALVAGAGLPDQPVAGAGRPDPLLPAPLLPDAPPEPPPDPLRPNPPLPIPLLPAPAANGHGGADSGGRGGAAL
jgi:cell division protease FtsH